MARRLMAGLAAAAMVAALAPAAWGGGGYGCASRQLTSGEGTEVKMVESCFMPNILRVDPMTTVLFTTEDIVPHTITSSAGQWQEVELKQGARETFRFTFSEPGVYPFYCRYHVNMGGTVLVGSAGDAVPVGATADDDRNPNAGAIAGIAVLLPIAAILGFLAGSRRRVTPSA